MDKNSANRIRFRTSPVRRDRNLGRRRFYALNKNGANRIRFRTSPVRRDRNLGRRRFHALDKTVRTKSAFAPRRWGVSGTWGDGKLRYIRKTKRRKTASALPLWRHGRIPGWRKVSPGEESWEPGGTSRRRNAAWHWCDGMGCAGTGMFARMTIRFISQAERTRKDDGGIYPWVEGRADIAAVFC